MRQFLLFLTLTLWLSSRISCLRTVRSAATPIKASDCIYALTPCNQNWTYYDGDCECVDCGPIIRLYGCSLNGKPQERLAPECRDILRLGYCELAMRDLTVTSLTKQAAAFTSNAPVSSTTSTSVPISESLSTLYLIGYSIGSVLLVLTLLVIIVVLVMSFCPRGRRFWRRLRGLTSSAGTDGASNQSDNPHLPIIHPFSSTNRVDIGVDSASCRGPCKTNSPDCPDDSVTLLSGQIFSCPHCALSRQLCRHCFLDGLSSQALTPDIPASSLSLSSVRQFYPGSVPVLSAPMLQVMAPGPEQLKCRQCALPVL